MRPDVSILSSGANIADARLHRLTNALLSAGLNVEIFAPGNPEHAPIGSVNNSSTVVAPNASLENNATHKRGSLVVHTPSSGPVGTLISKNNLFSRALRARVYAANAHGKILYAISPEAYAPALLSVRTTKKGAEKKQLVAVDIYEDYRQLLKDRAWAKKYFGILGAIAQLDTKVAMWAARRADLTTVADVQVPPFDARNRLVVRNLPDRSLLTPAGERSSTPRAIYIGDLRRSRGLHAMLRAAELSPSWNFDLVGPIAPADQAFVDDWKRAHVDAASRVRFFGKLPPKEAWKVAAGAWVGLTLLESTPAFVEAVPSKLYEYMAVGLATISTPLPRCAELLAKSGAGAIAAEPDDVSAILNRWSSDSAGQGELDAIRAKASAWASQNLDSESEYTRLAAAFTQLLGR